MIKLQLYLIFFTVLNILLHSNANYVGKANFQEIVKNSIEFKCEYTGAGGNGEFIGWYKGNEPISTDQTNHYAVTTSPKVTKLNITWDISDQQIKKWSVRTSKSNEETPSKCVFGQIRPTPQGIETDREAEKLNSNLSSVRRNEKESVKFKCILAPSPAHITGIQWKFSIDGEKWGALPNEVRITNITEITIDHVNKTHQGYYRCHLNLVTFTAILRVKNRLAALWPFIGIVCTVIVLVIGIFILERRQKLAKKSTTVEEEVNDPLVSSVNKPSDNENQKTKVNA